MELLDVYALDAFDDLVKSAAKAAAKEKTKEAAKEAFADTTKAVPVDSAARDAIALLRSLRTPVLTRRCVIFVLQ